MQNSQNENSSHVLCTLYRDKDIDELIYTGDWVDVRISAITEMRTGPQDLELEKARKRSIRIGRNSAIKVWHGFCLELPEGYEAIMKPRGSLFKNTGLIFSCSGVIDEGYKGNNDEWFSTFYATETVELEHNMRVCQFRIQKKQPKLSFKQVDTMVHVDRGGHGSTGVK